MPPIMFKLNQIYCSVANLKLLKMAAIVAILDIRRDPFYNSKSPCCLDAFHQVSALLDLLFGSRYQLKTFVMSTMDSDEMSKM